MNTRDPQNGAASRAQFGDLGTDAGQASGKEIEQGE